MVERLRLSLLQIVPNFLEEANILYEFFSEQCKSLSNNSALPSPCTKHTDERLSDLDFTQDKMVRISQALDSNKAHKHIGVFSNFFVLS